MDDDRVSVSKYFVAFVGSVVLVAGVAGEAAAVLYLQGLMLVLLIGFFVWGLPGSTGKGEAEVRAKEAPTPKAQPVQLRAEGAVRHNLPIRELSSRAVHGRAPLPVSDPDPARPAGRAQTSEKSCSKLQLEIARLHEICQGESMQTRSMVERQLRVLDGRKVPESQAVREVREMIRALVFQPEGHPHDEVGRQPQGSPPP